MKDVLESNTLYISHPEPRSNVQLESLLRPISTRQDTSFLPKIEVTLRKGNNFIESKIHQTLQEKLRNMTTTNRIQSHRFQRILRSVEAHPAVSHATESTKAESNRISKTKALRDN